MGGLSNPAVGIALSKPDLAQVLADELGRDGADTVLAHLQRFRLADADAVANARTVTRQELRAWRAEIQGRFAERAGSEAEPVVSVILPAFDTVRMSASAVVSLLSLETRNAFEIIVADDASTDGTEAVFAGCDGPVRYFRNPRNLGFLRNCNHAARLARGQYLLFLNNDLIVLPGHLDALLAIAADPLVGLVGSKLLNLDGSLQEAGALVWEDGTGWNFGRGEDVRHPHYSFVREMDYISGASILTPCDVWDELGGFSDVFAPAY